MNKTLKTASFIMLIIAIIGVCLVFLVNAEFDNDFFWHLKTGELIWQNKSLPSQDPFSFTSQGLSNPRERIILTSYWLSQIVYYLFYLAGGMSGIVFLKFLLLGALIYVILVLREGDPLLYTGLLLMTLLVTFEIYFFDRPQIFSFLMFGLLLYLLSRIKSEGIKSRFATFISMPLLMLVWANMHGGFILGQLTIILYIVLEGVKFTHKSLKPISREAYKRLVIAGVLGIVFSLANPNSYDVLLMALSPATTSVTQYIVEYLSSFEMLSLYNSYSIFLFWFIMALSIAGVAFNVKRVDISEVVLLAGLGYFSFTHVRYIFFFLIAALPATSRHLSNVKLLPVFRGVILAAAIFSSLFFMRNLQLDFLSVLSDPLVRSGYPVAASEFVLSEDIKGNMYNFYDWGGYLIWKLGPEKKVFTDGRIINENVYLMSMDINLALKDNYWGIPVWKAVFQGYQIKYAIIPFFYRNGPILPLAYALMQDREWVPVFASLNSFVFVKNDPENYQVIYRWAVPKVHVIKNLLKDLALTIKLNPWYVPAYVSAGDLHLLEKNFPEAKKAYKKALDLAPLNQIAQERLRLLGSR